MPRTSLLLLSLCVGCVSTVGEGGDGGPSTRASGSTTAATSTGTASTTGAASTSSGAATTTNGATTAGATSSAGATTVGATSSSGSTVGTTSGSTSGNPAPYCGDGIVQPDAGEVCDLGTNNGKGLGCNATCNLFGLVTTLAGTPNPGYVDGCGTAAQLARPYGLAVMGNFLYVADTSFRAVRALNLGDDCVQTIAGGRESMGGGCVDGDGLSTDPDSGFCEPDALLPFDGGLLVTDYGALRFLSLSPTFDGGTLSTFAGATAVGGTERAGFDGGPFDACIYGEPKGIAQIGLGIFTNTDINGLIAESNLATDEMYEVATLGSIVQQGGMTALGGLAYTSDSSSQGAIYAYNPTMGQIGMAGDAGFELNPSGLNSPDGICNDGVSIYICETGNNDIRQLDPTTGALSLVAGGNPNTNSQADGLGADAGFFDPAGCAWDPVRKVLYISDRSGNTIREIQ